MNTLLLFWKRCKISMVTAREYKAISVIGNKTGWLQRKGSTTYIEVYIYVTNITWYLKLTIEYFSCFGSFFYFFFFNFLFHSTHLYIS